MRSLKDLDLVRDGSEKKGEPHGDAQEKGVKSGGPWICANHRSEGTMRFE